MGRKKLYNILLREGEREELKRNLRKGKSSARSQTRARILLLADEGRDDDEIIDILKVSKSTVCRIKKDILRVVWILRYMKKPAVEPL